MEKINRQRAPKGTVTIRKKGNSYEARVTLALNSIMEGVDKNPRLSRKIGRASCRERVLIQV